MIQEQTAESMPETALADYTPTGSYVAERDEPKVDAPEIEEEAKEVEAPAKEPSKEEAELAEDIRKRIAGIARKDRDLSRKQKELEDNVRQFAQWRDQELLELEKYRAAREAAKRGDNIALLQSLEADTNALYSDMTALAIDGKLDISKLSQPKQDETYKKIAEELTAARQEIEALKEHKNNQEREAGILRAHNFIQENRHLFPRLAESDNGTVLWDAAKKAYDEDPTITAEQVARDIEQQLREQSKSNLEFWQRVNSAGVELEAPNESLAEQPKPIAKTITNKANAAQMPKNLHDKLKGVRDLQERARIMKKYYMDHGE